MMSLAYSHSLSLSFALYTGKESGLVKTVARGTLLAWAVKRFPELKVGTDMKALVPQLCDCMNDKDSKVRAYAEQVVTIMVAKKGASHAEIMKGLEKLTGAAQRSTKERLQNIFDSTEVETPAAKASEQTR